MSPATDDKWDTRPPPPLLLERSAVVPAAVLVADGEPAPVLALPLMMLTAVLRVPSPPVEAGRRCLAPGGVWGGGEEKAGRVRARGRELRGADRYYRIGCVRTKHSVCNPSVRREGANS